MAAVAGLSAATVTVTTAFVVSLRDAHAITLLVTESTGALASRRVAGLVSAGLAISTAATGCQRDAGFAAPLVATLACEAAARAIARRAGVTRRFTWRARVTTCCDTLAVDTIVRAVVGV